MIIIQGWLFHSSINNYSFYCERAILLVTKEITFRLVALHWLKDNRETN